MQHQPAAQLSQHARKRNRQLLDSSSDSETESSPAKRLAPFKAVQVHQTHATSGHDAYEQTEAGFENHGNEPQLEEEDFQDPVDLCGDAEDSPGQGQHTGRQPTAGQQLTDVDVRLDCPGLTAGASTAEQDRPATVDLTDDPPSQDQAGSAAAGYSATQQERQLQAVSTLHRLPYTTFALIAAHAQHLPASDFPKTLRINAKMVRTISKLVYKDSQGNALPEYAIDVELQDETQLCPVGIGHELLCSMLGKLL